MVDAIGQTKQSDCSCEKARASASWLAGSGDLPTQMRDGLGTLGCEEKLRPDDNCDMMSSPGSDSYFGMRVKLWMETFAPPRARSLAGRKIIVISSNRRMVANLTIGNRKVSSTGGRLRGI
jgi:hypothetical protein